MSTIIATLTLLHKENDLKNCDWEYDKTTQWIDEECMKDDSGEKKGIMRKHHEEHHNQRYRVGGTVVTASLSDLKKSRKSKKQLQKQSRKNNR